MYRLLSILNTIKCDIFWDLLSELNKKCVLIEIIKIIVAKSHFLGFPFFLFFLKFLGRFQNPVKLVAVTVQASG